MAIIPDYFINSTLYAGMPDASRVYELIRDSGYGIIKMPPLDLPKKSIAGWVISTADQVQEYLNRGFSVVMIGFRPLPQSGLWIDMLKAELGRRGIVIPRTKIISKKELTKGLVALRGFLSS